MSGRAEQLLAKLPPGKRDVDRAELEAALERSRFEGRAAWPELDVGDEQWLAAIAASLPPDRDIVTHLGGTSARDLWIAAACATGRSDALRAFEREYFAKIEPALRRMKLEGHARDEVRQTVREKLFVADSEGVMPLHGYLGRGDLRSFVRVVATRTALDLLRKQRGGVTPSDRDDTPQLAGDESPELALLKATHAQDFKSAFEDAIGAMQPRDRTLLRLSFVDKLSVDEIGAMYGIHRSTAARQVARARADLAERTRELLASRLRLGEGEFTSVVRLIQSQLDLSISRVLGD